MMDIKQFEVMVWIHLVQGREEWQAVVNMVVNFQIP
jgi:hypothetical protein